MPFTDKPLVVLFGPSTAGKTAILGRMVRYLKVKGKNFNEGNSFIIDGDFITDNAGLKEVLEEQLLDFCNKSKVVIKKTSALLYALVHTTDYAILEVAGELLTSGDGTKLKDKDKGAAQIVRENVLHNPENKVISVILLDTDISDKESYVDTIKKEFTKKYVYESNVKIIFLINKFDKIKKGYGAEIGKTFEAEKWIEENFPNLLNKEECHFYQKARWWQFGKDYIPMFEILTFSTGNWSIRDSEDPNNIGSEKIEWQCDFGTETEYGVSKGNKDELDSYPEALDNSIYKFITGRKR